MLCIKQPARFNVFTHAAYKPHNTTHTIKANIRLGRKKMAYSLQNIKGWRRELTEGMTAFTQVWFYWKQSFPHLSMSLHDLISFTSYCHLPLSDHKSIRTDLLVMILGAWNYFHLRGFPEADMVFHLEIPYRHLFQPSPVSHLWQGVP